MTDAWVNHIKDVQKQYRQQGTPISYHQAMVVAKRTWPQIKSGEKPAIKVEAEHIPPHNTKPREKREPPSRKPKEEYEYEEPVRRKLPPKQPVRKPPPRDEYEPPRRRPPPRDEYEDYYEYEPPRRRPPPRDEYEDYYQPRGRGRPPKDSFKNEYEEY